MEHEHHGNQRDHERNKDGIGSAKEEIALEHLGHPPHRILADQDARDEGHMAPHKKTEEQTAGALSPIQPGGPVTFPRPLIQSGSGDDIDFTVHCTSLSIVQLLEKKNLRDFDHSKRALRSVIQAWSAGIQSTRMSPEASLQTWMLAIHDDTTRSNTFHSLERA